MRTTAIALLTIALSGFGCATASGADKQYASKGVVLPNSMCGPKGSPAASNDPKGARMICEMEDFTGSHVSKCVCRDEGEFAAGRDSSQQYLRDMETKCVTRDNGKCNAM
jgi:hypothetical protein